MNGVLKLIAILAVLFFTVTGLMFVLDLAPPERIAAIAGRGFVVLVLLAAASAAVGLLIKEKK